MGHLLKSHTTVVQLSHVALFLNNNRKNIFPGWKRQQRILIRDLRNKRENFCG